MSHRQPIRKIALLLLITILAACQTAAPAPAIPLATPASTPVMLATAMPTAEGEPAPTATETWVPFVDEARSLSLYHPASWLVFTPTSGDLTELFGAVEGAAIEELAVMVRLLTASADDLSIFSALGFILVEQDEPSPSYVDNFTAIVLPAENMSPDLYARVVSKQLAELPTLVVAESAVLAGLRPDGLEVASIRYTVDGALYGVEDTDLTGWQVVLLDQDGERFLVLTFTAVAANFERLEMQFVEVVNRVEF